MYTLRDCYYDIIFFLIQAQKATWARIISIRSGTNHGITLIVTLFRSKLGEVLLWSCDVKLVASKREVRQLWRFFTFCKVFIYDLFYSALIHDDLLWQNKEQNIWHFMPYFFLGLSYFCTPFFSLILLKGLSWICAPWSYVRMTETIVGEIITCDLVYYSCGYSIWNHSFS